MKWRVTADTTYGHDQVFEALVDHWQHYPSMAHIDFMIEDTVKGFKGNQTFSIDYDMIRKIERVDSDDEECYISIVGE